MATTYDGDQGDVSRRDFIYIAATAFAAIGAAAALWPLIDQMNPDASALSLASTEVDLAPVGVGQAITVLWRGKPIFIRHRTPEEIKMAQDVKVADLKDPFADVMGGRKGKLSLFVQVIRKRLRARDCRKGIEIIARGEVRTTCR